MVGPRAVLCLFALLVLGSGCQTTLDSSDRSLASIMAEMEVHMNSMYRTVGDLSQWDETREDGVLLLALQERALEFVRRWRIEGQAKLVAQMENSIRLNAAFLQTLESGDRDLARESLDRMDEARRRCHADFG